MGGSSNSSGWGAFTERDKVTGLHIQVFLPEISELIMALGNASGFIQAYLLRDDLTDYQREGAAWMLEKIRKAGKMIQDKEPFQ